MRQYWMTIINDNRALIKYILKQYQISLHQQLDGPNQIGVAPGAKCIAAKAFDAAGNDLVEG